MVALPEPKTVEAIYDLYNEPEEMRPYLGASAIGEECRRKLWLQFRWVGQPSFPPRIKRLFQTGHREEDRIIGELFRLGLEVKNRQTEYTACDGHFKAHLDGTVLGLLEAPKTEHVLEIKTMSKKRFDAVWRKGVKESDPKYYDQVQVCMGLTKLKRTAFLVECKDDDRLYLERVKYETAKHTELLRKAKSIIYADHPPERIAGDPDKYPCKFCDMRYVCWDARYPEVNCRTCAYATPGKNGLWNCASSGLEIIPEFGDDTCLDHIYLPYMLHWLEPLNGGPGWVEYKDFINVAADGFPAKDKPHYSSKQLFKGVL